MSDRKIRIGLETTGDTKAVDDATKKVDNLSKTNKKSAKSGEDAGKGGIQASKGFAAMGQTAAASSGSIGGLASALGGMAQQLPALAGMAGPVGLAIAAFMAWKSAIEAVHASQESLAKGLRDTAAGNVEAGVRSLIRYYNDLQKAISDAADEARMYADAEASKDDAKTKSDLAKLELDRARRLASLAPGDTLGARAVDLDAAERRAGIEDAAAKRRSDRELAALRAQEAASAAAMNAAQGQRGALEGRFSELGGQYAATADRMRSRIDSSWTPGGKQRAAEEGERELARIAAAMEKVAEEIRAATSAVSQEQRKQYGLSQQAEVNLIGRGTLEAQQQAGGFQRSAASSALSRDVSADVAARQKAVEDTRQSRADAQRGVLAAEAGLRNARNRGADGAEVGMLKAELEQARKARAEADRIIIDNARQQAAQSTATAAAIKDIQARAARPGSGG